MRVDYTVPQGEFRALCTTDGVRHGLFVGGYGSGKTEMLVFDVLADLLRYRGESFAIYEPTYDLIKLVVSPRLEEWFERLGLDYTLNRTENRFRVPGFGSVYMRSMSNPERIIAYQVFRSYVDEIDTLPREKAEDVHRRIMARERGRAITEPDAANQTKYYTTPEGRRFCYSRWHRDVGPGYAMVRAPTRTNTHNPGDYEAELRRTYPAALVEAYCEGYFVNMTEGAIFPDFDRDANGTDVVESESEGLLVGCDFNVDRMAYVVHVVRNGYPVSVAEGHNLRDTPTMIDHITERFVSEKRPARRITVVPDASGGHRDTRSPGKSDLRLLADAGFTVDSPAANPEIRNRINAANALILNATGERRWLVNVARCPDLVQCLEEIAWEKGGYPKPGDEFDLSHKIDAATYPIHKRWPIERYRAFSGRRMGEG